MDHLHRPSELLAEKELNNDLRKKEDDFYYLSQDIEIAECRHVWVRPCVHRNIIPRIECCQELIGIVEHVDANHEMRGGLVDRVQEINKVRRGLNGTVRV